MKYSNNVITCSKSNKERIKDEGILKGINKLEEKLKKFTLGKEKGKNRKRKLKHRDKRNRSKKSRKKEKKKRERKVKKLGKR